MAIAPGNIYIPDFQLFVPEIAVSGSTVFLSNYDDLYDMLLLYKYRQGISYAMSDLEVGIISKAPRRKHPERCYNSNPTTIAYKLGASGYHSIHRAWWTEKLKTYLPYQALHRPKCYTISWRHICYNGIHFNFSLNNSDNRIDGLFDYAHTRNSYEKIAGCSPISKYRGNHHFTHTTNDNAAHVVTYLGVIFRLKTPSGYLETDMSKMTIACIPASSAWRDVKIGPTWGWADCLDVALDDTNVTKLW